MASRQHNEAFKNQIIQDYPLDYAIDYIASNMNPDEVFSRKQLIDWAIENGFKEDEQ